MGMQLHLVHRGLDGAEGQQVRKLLRREVGNTDRVNQTLRITHLPQPYSLHELLHLRPRALQVFHIVAETILGIIRDKANVVVAVTLVSLLVLLLRQIQEGRPVDQIQVKVLQLELLQVLLQRPLHILRLPVRNPQLRRHPEILSLHNALVNALLNGFPNSGLITVKTLRCTVGRRQWGYVKGGRIDHAVSGLDGVLNSRRSVVIRSLPSSTSRNNRNPTQVPTQGSYIQS